MAADDHFILRELLQGTPLGIIVTDTDGLCQRIEGSVMEALGLLDPALLDRPASRVLPTYDVFQVPLRHALAGRPLLATGRLERRTLQVRFVPATEAGTVHGALGIIQDVTSRAELDRRMRGERLRPACNDGFSLFLAEGHALRTPLTSLMLAFSAWKARHPDDAETQLIQRNLERLRRAVEGVSPPGHGGPRRASEAGPTVHPIPSP